MPGVQPLAGVMIYHTDFDKRHRCPNCWYLLPDVYEAPWWTVHTCRRCGTKAARWPLLPAYPGTWYVFSGRPTWRNRFQWQMRRNCRYIVERRWAWTARRRRLTGPPGK